MPLGTKEVYMKITLESPINKYYVQTLGMIFFPGEHFGEKAEPLYERLSQYFQILENYKFITFN